MARYEAQVWVSGEHPYQCEINAANIFDARKNIARREGVQEHEVNRIFEMRDDTNSSQSSSSSWSSSGTDMGGMLGLCAVLFVLWLIIEYWMFIIPITLIIAILYYFGTKN